MPAIATAPCTDHQQAFLAMLADLETNDPPCASFYAAAKTDFAAYVQSLLDEEHGRHLPDGWVPCTHRWLIAENAVVGVTRLRHRIDTPFLFENVGHIGYDVAPAHRGRGYGHAAMRASLAEARSVGLQRVLLLTGETNAPSRAIIERQQGTLESIAFSEFWDERLCRYWVEVPTRIATLDPPRQEAADAGACGTSR